MFNKSLDSKSTFNVDGIEMKDLTESIYKSTDPVVKTIHNYYKVPFEMEMRIDKISYAVYGSEKYAEILMKESEIDNPFAIEEGDVIKAPFLSDIYVNIKDIEDFNTNNGYSNKEKEATAYERIANYHKYIDEKKLPKDNGSEVVNINIPSKTVKNSNAIDPALEYIEPNMANRGKSGIHIENGRIYFGDSISSSTANPIDIQGTNDTDSPLVDCAKNGVSLGQFLNATIKNTIK